MNKDNNGPSPMISLEINPKDPSRQDERAQLDLFRSISIGKMIAVIGSGVTTAYGYDTWGVMLQKLLLKLKQMHKDKPNVYFDEFGINYANAFFNISPKKGDDDYYLSVYGSIVPHLTEAGKMELHGEYTNLFGPRLLVNKRSAKKTFPGLKLPKCNGNYLPQDFSNLLLKLAELVDKILDDVTDPNHYSNSLKTDFTLNKLNAQRIRSDRNLVDPLDNMRSSLRIRRFATFNYDLEIESLFEDYDYPYGALTTGNDGTIPSQSRLGSIARSISLSQSNVSELISLAAVPADEDETVVHLHGSVTQKVDMVVTQKDYDKTYIDNHPEHKAFEDARKLMFGGNSVLYVGVGMREEDVLRPLRYLASVVSDRPIYALIPSLESHEKDIAFAKKIKSAYRINAIHYGPSDSEIPKMVTRLGVDHPLGDKFKALYDEVKNIDNFISFALLGKKQNEIRHYLNKKNSPRLNIETNHIKTILFLARIIEEKGAVFAKDKDDLEKKKKIAEVAEFYTAARSIATSVALNHALQVMAKAGHNWRQEWKIRRSKNHDASHTKTISSLHNIDLNSPLPTDTDAAESFIKKIIEKENSILVFRFSGGRGLSSIASISKKINKVKIEEIAINTNCHIINLNYVVSANSILPLIYENIRAKSIDRAIENTIDIFFINGAERLMERGGTEVQNLASLRFLFSLKSILRKKNTSVKVVLLSRRNRTANKLGELLNVAPAINEKYKEAYDPLPLEDNEYLTIRELCSEFRWPYFVVRYIFNDMNKSSEDKKTILNIIENLLQSRMHSVDTRNKQSVFCGAVLDAFHTHAQRRFNAIERIGLAIQHTILKWMFAVRIPINCQSILLLPEIKNINVLYKDVLDESNCVFGAFVSEQIVFLYELNFILMLESTKSTSQDATEQEKNIRYVLHANVTWFLAHKRGISFGWMDHREWNSATLCSAMMDGGPMLNKVDYLDSCAVYEAFLDSGDLRALHCAFAIIRGHLYAPNAMRAGLMYADKTEDRSAIDLHVSRLSKLRSASIALDNKERTRTPQFELFQIWVANEIGVMKLVQGDFHDSVMLFREALNFIRSDRISNTDSDARVDSDPAIVLRIRINLSLALIERAHFEQAGKLINSVIEKLNPASKSLVYEEDYDKFEPNDEKEFYLQPESNLLRALSYGCKAQIELLTANLDAARRSINEAMFDEEGKKPRMAALDLIGVRGWLYGLSAQVASASGEDRIAAEEWMKALAAARGSLRPDLILSMEIAEIEFQIRRCKGNREIVLSALSTLGHLEKTARALGSHKARVGILLIRARALLYLEQSESAREAIIDSICLSLLNGMRLKRVSGLVLMVGLMALRGERVAAKQLLKSVRLIATRLRYIRAALDLDRLEREIEMDGSISAWAGHLLDSASD